jgi:hypothetical protein
MQTQERATLRSAVTQLHMQANISMNKENIENDDDSDWLHRNDAYHMNHRHHQQTHYPIFPTMASGIIYYLNHGVCVLQQLQYTLLTILVNIRQCMFLHTTIRSSYYPAKRTPDTVYAKFNYSQLR